MHYVYSTLLHHNTRQHDSLPNPIKASICLLNKAHGCDHFSISLEQRLIQ